MTKNQLEYQSLREDKRHNEISEAETKRSNLAKETETNRSNLAEELETKTHNRISETNEGNKNAITGLTGTLNSLGNIMKGVGSLASIF
jgi:vacuolar-type H+-ATPase subunit I/STV1